MLRVHFHQSYKSITAQDPFDLPQFVVLVGANGSGKTQLLEGISNSIAKCEIGGKSNPAIQFMSIKQFLERSDGRGQKKDFYGIYENIYNHIKQQVNTDNWETLNLDQKRKRSQKSNNKNPFMESVCPIVIDRLGPDKNKINISSIMKVLSASEIEGFDNDKIIINSLSRHFYNYFCLYDRNRYQKYLETIGEEHDAFLDDSTFFERHGRPPWDVINDFLRHTGLGLTVDRPRNTENDYRIMISTPTVPNIPFSDLSSGEQVLLQIAGAILKSEEKVVFPDLILLDEPDAALHPSMAALMIEALNDTFVRKHGAHMIVATHTPTTVATCDESSIYMMDRKKRKPIKVERQAALLNLLSGLPIVNIYVADQKAVFVESKYDQEFLQKLFNSWKPDDISRSLHFLSSGSSQKSGSCQIVYEMVRNLRRAQAQNIYGLVDFDNTNCDDDHILILGAGERYAIEQFILDPLFIAILLVRDRHKCSMDIGLNRDIDDHEFRDCESHELQDVVDCLTDQLKRYIFESQAIGLLDSDYINNNSDKVEVTTANGINYHIEKWFLYANGHNIEELWLSAFPELKEYQKNQQNRLKRIVVDLVIRRHIGFLSVSLIKTFETLLEKPG